MILYLKVKAIKELKELRDSSQVQALMGQQKPVQHHIHVVLWGKKQNKRSVISEGNLISILYLRQQIQDMRDLR